MIIPLALGCQSPNGRVESAQAARPPGPARQVRVRIEVADASLPVTIGVPMARESAVVDDATLAVVDAAGSAVPAETRVLSRWNGPAGDAGRPIKWVLVDFVPAGNGAYYLTNGASRAAAAGVRAEKSGAEIVVTSTRLRALIAASGAEIVSRLTIDGSEALSAPARLEARLPARAIVVKTDVNGSMSVTEAGHFKAGDSVAFENRDRLKWESPAGDTRIVTRGVTFVAGRTCRIEEGTPRQEDAVIAGGEATDHRAASPLRFSHPAGSSIRDLRAEEDAAVVARASGQSVTFSSPPRLPHRPGEILRTAVPAESSARAVIENATVEEANGLRAVVRQNGRFIDEAHPGAHQLRFAIRHYFYAGKPYIRIRLRLINDGPYGFGSDRTGQPPFARHIILKELAALFPAAAARPAGISIADSAAARAAIAAGGGTGAVTTGAVEIAVPEFAANYPRALKADGSGIRFEILPDTGQDHIFDGARARMIDLYLGRGAGAASRITGMANAVLEPQYVASTGAVRPSFIERRDWKRLLPASDRSMAEAAARFEDMLAAAYAVERTSAAGSVPATSIFEYRLRGENGEQFGWRNFGDLAWADGYANLHYDLPFILLREHLRTGDRRAFQLGSEMARYRADWGHYQADDYFDRERVWNLKGMAFYEKGDHGSFKEPAPSHTWIEGMWLYWAMTGDEAVRESAVDGSEAFARMNFNYYNALGWNEPRWLGWPTLGLLVAWRYTGEERYLKKARQDVELFIDTEESFGRKGYYISRGSDVIQATQPWAWCYSLLGVIEYWRETADPRAAGLIARAADWLVGTNSHNPPIKSAVSFPDGSYRPAGISYFWAPEKAAEDRSVALCGLCLPVIVAAAEITGRDDLRARAAGIFRDYAFYRDFPEDRPIDPRDRAVINFRSLQFPGSVTKVYGQMGLTVPEYLAEIARQAKRGGTER